MPLFLPPLFVSFGVNQYQSIARQRYFSLQGLTHISHAELIHQFEKNVFRPIGVNHAE